MLAISCNANAALHEPTMPGFSLEKAEPPNCISFHFFDENKQAIANTFPGWIAHLKDKQAIRLRLNFSPLKRYLSPEVRNLRLEILLPDQVSEFYSLIEKNQHNEWTKEPTGYSRLVNLVDLVCRPIGQNPTTDLNIKPLSQIRGEMLTQLHKGIDLGLKYSHSLKNAIAVLTNNQLSDYYSSPLPNNIFHQDAQMLHNASGIAHGMLIDTVYGAEYAGPEYIKGAATFIKQLHTCICEALIALSNLPI